MVSEQHDILQFFGSTQDLSYPELILYAEQEAVRAERMCLKGAFDEAATLGKCQDYADCMKNLIFFMRYGMRPANVSEGIFELFEELCRNVSVRQRTAARCTSSQVMLV